MPVAEDFDDVYFSNHDGLKETQYVFIEQNTLCQRWADWPTSNFTIAESGFGTGLNFLATWQTLKQQFQNQQTGELKQLQFISFERYPMAKQDIAKALSHWPELVEERDLLLSAYPEYFSQGCHRLVFEGEIRLVLDLWIGDIHESLAQMQNNEQGLVDCWFLDGFAPSKNPEMWTQALFEQMSRLAKVDCHFATFTAAGFVKRGLQAAGFKVNKVKGYGRKREMLCGALEKIAEQKNRPAEEQPYYQRISSQELRDVAIIGGGIAGASLAYALCKRGVRVTLYEQHQSLANEASGNRQGAIYPLLSPTQALLSEFFIRAFEFNRDLLARLGDSVEHQWCGVLQLAYDDKSAEKNAKVAAAGYPQELVQPLSAEHASSLAGVKLAHPALHYPTSGWAYPQQLVQQLIAQAQQSGNLTLKLGQQVLGFVQHEQTVELALASEKVAHQAAVFCNAHQLKQLVPQLPLSAVRGQVSHINSDGELSELKKVLCYDGYLTPANPQACHCIGATYQKDQAGGELTEAEHQHNLDALARCEPQDWNAQLSLAPSEGRAAVRCVIRDHLPLIGNLPDFTEMAKPAYQQQLRERALPQYQRVFTNVGFGSRGICSAPFAAELLASQMCGESLAASKQLLAAVHPARFWVRKLLKGRPVS